MATREQIEKLLEKDESRRSKAKDKSAKKADADTADSEPGGPRAFFTGMRRGLIQRAPVAAMEMQALARGHSPFPATTAFDAEAGTNTIRGLRQSADRNFEDFKRYALSASEPGDMDYEGPMPRLGPEADDGSLAYASGERLGESLPFASGGLTSSIVSQGVKLGVLEIAAEVAASTAGAAVERGGGGGFLQAGGEMAAAAMLPAMTVNRITRRGANAARKAFTGTAVGELVDEASKRLGARIGKDTLDDTTIRKIAQRLGVDENTLKRVSGEAKRRFPEDPTGREDFIRQAIRKLEEVEELFPDPRMRPTTRQAMGELEAQNLSSIDEQFAQTDLKYSNQVAGRRLAIQQDLEKQMDNLTPNGTVGMVTDSYDDVLERVQQRNRELWAAVDMEKMPLVSTSRLKSAARADIRRVGLKRNIPSEVQDILDLPDEITVEQLQNIRSDMLLTDRVARRNGGERAIRSSSNTTNVRKQLREEVMGLQVDGSDELKAAIADSREMHDMFALDSRAVQALSEHSETPKIVSRIRNAKKPAEEARRVIRILEQQGEESVDAFRRIVIDDLFGIGQEFAETNPRTLRRNLMKNEAFYRESLGSERFDKMVTVMRKAEMERRGRAGTAAATAGTGTGITPAGILFSSAEAISQPGPLQMGRGFKEVGKAIWGSVKGEREKIAVLREAMLDPTLMRVLLEMPTERTQERWIREFGVLVGRAKLREKLSIAQRSGLLGGSNDAGGDVPPGR